MADTCETCGMSDGIHDMRKHRMAIRIDAELAKSIRNHPAKGRPKGEDDNG